MRSETPGMPGRSTQIPRTISSICTPAWEARYSALTTSGSWSEFILATMRPRPVSFAICASRSISSITADLSPSGATRNFFQQDGFE